MTEPPTGTAPDTDLIDDADADRRRETPQTPCFWTIRNARQIHWRDGESIVPPVWEYDIRMIQVADLASAQAAFGETRMGRVHDLTTPDLVWLLMETPTGLSLELQVDRLPSARDVTRTMTRQEMEGAGFDPS